jgi:hypothetical protein
MRPSSSSRSFSNFIINYENEDEEKDSFERNSGDACLFNYRLAEVFVRRDTMFSARLA